MMEKYYQKIWFRILNHLKIDKIRIINEEIIQDQDWIAQSQAQFPEITISNNLQIIPPWQKIKNKSIKNVIINQEPVLVRISSNNKNMFRLD